MKIVFAPTYKQGATQYHVIHNAGGTATNIFGSSLGLTAEQVNAAHKARWSFPSQFMKRPDGTPCYGGYNFYIDQLGEVTQFRAIGEETAAQIGYNFDGLAISICLAGNGERSPQTGQPVDQLNGAQITALRALQGALPQVWYPNIVPHRQLQPSTSCYGSGRDSAWGRNLIIAGVIERIQAQIMDLLAKIKAMQAGSAFAVNCDEANVRG